jgi:hypothetical protein
LQIAAIVLASGSAAGFQSVIYNGRGASGAFYFQGIVFFRAGHVPVGVGDLVGLEGATMRESSFWSVTVPRVLSTYAIVIFAMLWVGFAIALVVNREWLDLLWNWVRALPFVAGIVVWVLFLPIMAGLWIWESSWPALVRLLAFAGIVVWTLLAVSSFIRSVR